MWTLILESTCTAVCMLGLCEFIHCSGRVAPVFRCITSRAIVREQLHSLHETTLQQLNGLLSVEGLPFTLNHTYLKEYKNKFLAHYRDIRQRSKGHDTIVRRLQEPEGTVAAPAHPKLADLTDLLQRFGLTCTPKDLHRLLPEDELEPALDIIATVRAYFQG